MRRLWQFSHALLSMGRTGRYAWARFYNGVSNKGTQGYQGCVLADSLSDAIQGLICLLLSLLCLILAALCFISFFVASDRWPWLWSFLITSILYAFAGVGIVLTCGGSSS